MMKLSSGIGGYIPFPLVVIFLAVICSGNIITPPADTAGVLGGRAVFTCHVDLQSHRTLSWSFNSLVIYTYLGGLEEYPLQDDKYSVKHDESNFTLIVNNLKYESGGKYTCKAAIFHEATAELIVLGKPSITLSTSSPVEGEIVQYACQCQFAGPSEYISSNSYPQLTMLMNGDQLDWAANETMEVNEHYSRLEKVYTVRVDSNMHGQQLMCQAATISAVVTTSDYTVIDILWLMMEPIPVVVIVLLSICSVPGNIITPPADTAGVLGGRAVFTCHVDLQLQRTLSWTFNNLIIYSYLAGLEEYPLQNDKYLVKHDECNFTLIVNNLKYESGGKYTCIAAIFYEATAELIVLGKPFITHPTSSPIEGEIVKYACQCQFGGPSEYMSSESYPKLTLSMNGHQLDWAANETMEVNEHYYRLEKVYTVRVDANMHGQPLMCQAATISAVVTTSDYTLIDVLYPVSNVTYVPHNDKYEVETILKCMADGNPEPSYEWRNDILEGSFIENKWLNITKNMVGQNKWRCTARNTIDEYTHEASITATFEVGGWNGMSLKVPPKDATYRVGEQAKFECLIDLKFTKLIRWEYNGNVLYSFDDRIETSIFNHDKYSFVIDGETFILLVKHLELDDGGKYTCRVNQQPYNANLVVLDQPKIWNYFDTKEQVIIYACDGQFGGPQKDDISPKHLPKLRLFLDGKPVGTNSKGLESDINYYTLRMIYDTEPTAGIYGKTLLCELKTEEPEKYSLIEKQIAHDSLLEGRKGVHDSGWKIAISLSICFLIVLFGSLGGVCYAVKKRNILQSVNDSRDKKGPVTEPFFLLSDNTLEEASTLLKAYGNNLYEKAKPDLSLVKIEEEKEKLMPNNSDVLVKSDKLSKEFPSLNNAPNQCEEDARIPQDITYASSSKETLRGAHFSKDPSSLSGLAKVNMEEKKSKRRC